MNEIYDVTQISGYENMDEEDKKYFERYGNYIIDQAEVIADQHYVDSDTMSDAMSDVFDKFLNILTCYKDEYIVEGAPLTCSMCTNKIQHIRVSDLSNEIVKSAPINIYNGAKLIIPEDREEKINELNPAKVTDTLGGMRDDKRDKNINIVSFGNCKYMESVSLMDIAEILHKESFQRGKKRIIPEIMKELLFSIKSGKGTCYCLMQLIKKWENFPNDFDYIHGGFNYTILEDSVVETESEDDGGETKSYTNSYMEFNGEEGINMLSMLFCTRGGIIRPLESGQSTQMQLLRITKNKTALSHTTLLSSTALGSNTQKKIQDLCMPNGSVYFDENGYQRVKCEEYGLDLDSDPYLVALAKYYFDAATNAGVGDSQGYGAIFQVTLSSGKVIYVTLGDMKDPAHTESSYNNEGEHLYAGSEGTANTLEFICNFLNNRSGFESDNMTAGKGHDASLGTAKKIMEEASIESIMLLRDTEIKWNFE